MARKSVQERTANLKINPYYEAKCDDLVEIMKLGKPFEIIHAAFRFGYLQGAKATKKEMRAKK